MKLLAIIASVLSGTACDDDRKKEAPEYEVLIYFSEDVKIEWHKMRSEGKFKKPMIEVAHPEGVAVERWVKPARKKTVYDFSLADGVLLVFLFSAAAAWIVELDLTLRSLRTRRRDGVAMSGSWAT